MGDFLSISICNERGLRALLRDPRNPTWSVASPPADAFRERNRSHPRLVGTPALSPVFVRRGSDLLAFPPFAPRAELIAHPFAKPSVSTLKRSSELDPCSPIDEPATLSRGVPPRASAFRRPAVRVPRPSRDVLYRPSAQCKKKVAHQCDFFIHSTPQASPSFSTIPHKSRYFVHSTPWTPPSTRRVRTSLSAIVSV